MANKKEPSEILVIGDVAYVQLSRGYVAKIDAVDVHLVEEHFWTAKVERNGRVSALRCPRVNGKPNTIYMHRVIVGASGGIHVDHRNGDPLDNRRCNLRFATCSQNCANRRIPSNNKSGVKGVYFNKAAGKWAAAIKVNGRKIHLGRFDSISAAADARTEAELRYQGDFRWQPNLHENMQ